MQGQQQGLHSKDPTYKWQDNQDKAIRGPKPQAPLPQCYASDYMCCWGKDGKIVVKYVGAQKRKEIMRSVCVMTGVGYSRRKPASG